MISNKGFLVEHITLLTEGEETTGVVSVNKNNTCHIAEENDAFLGVMVNNRNNIAAVQVKGYAEVKFSGEVGLGVTRVCCDGLGGIKADTNGREVIVLSLDTENNTATIIM